MANAAHAPQSAEQTPERPETHTHPQQPSGGLPETHHRAVKVSASARELRDAVAKLRKHAKAAPSGPWTCVPRYRKGTEHLTQVELHQPTAPGDAPRQRTYRPTYLPEVVYTALMHPGVGIKLAKLLDTRLWIAENDPGAFGTDTDKTALSIARLINNGPEAVTS